MMQGMNDYCAIIELREFFYKFFLKNPRLSMMVRIFDKMKTDRKKLILSAADKFIKANTI